MRPGPLASYTLPWQWRARPQSCPWAAPTQTAARWGPGLVASRLPAVAPTVATLAAAGARAPPRVLACPGSRAPRAGSARWPTRPPSRPVRRAQVAARVVAGRVLDSLKGLLREGAEVGGRAGGRGRRELCPCAQQQHRRRCAPTPAGRTCATPRHRPQAPTAEDLGRCLTRCAIPEYGSYGFDDRAGSHFTRRAAAHAARAATARARRHGSQAAEAAAWAAPALPPSLPAPRHTHTG